MPDTENTEFSRAGATIAKLFIGCVLILVGGYIHFVGLEPAENSSLSPAQGNPNSGTSNFLAETGDDAAFTPAPNRPPEIADTIISMLGRGSSSSRWIFVLGLLLAVWGLYKLQQELSLRDSGDESDSYLQSAYADGIDPTSLHAEEDIDMMQARIKDLHQKKVLWSLPFWFTTLLLLIVNKGSLGNPTPIGISDLWLMAITMGIYLLCAFIYWRCPACDAQLGKHHDRLTCDKCGIRLVSHGFHSADEAV